MSSRMFELIARGNNALAQNPPIADIDISTHASDFLWAIFTVMIVSAFALYGMGFTRPQGQRGFHTLAAAICFTASIAYFCMASDLGAAAVRVEYIRGGSLGANQVRAGVQNPTRSIWYARYIDWTITTPLLLLELLLCTGLPLSDIFMTIFFDIVMIETGLIGALIPSVYKWGLFAFGCAALVQIWYMLIGPGLVSAGHLGTEYKKAYIGSAAVLSFLWLLYPIAWGLADGGNVITPTGEMIFYGILDLLAKPVFCFYHVFMLNKIDYNRLGFRSGKFSEFVTEEGGYYPNSHGQQTLNGAATKEANPRASESTAVHHGNTAAPAATTTA